MVARKPLQRNAPSLSGGTWCCPTGRVTGRLPPRAGRTSNATRRCSRRCSVLGARTWSGTPTAGSWPCSYIAAGHPELVRSLTLIEPPAFWLAPEDPATVAMSAANRTLIEDPPSDPWETLERFFALVGMEPLPAVLASMKPLPPPLIQAAHILLSLRGPWEGDVPMTELADAEYPVQVLTSGRIAGFEGIAKALVEGAGATHTVVPGTHHAVQDAGDAVNPLLQQFWSAAEGAPG